MLNPSKKYGKIQDNLTQAITIIFSKQFNPSQFFPLLAQFIEDPDLKEPANLIFSIYNLLIRQEPETAYNGLIKIHQSNPNSVANVAGLVVRSAYQAYKKKYKESLDCLSEAIQLSQNQNLDRQLSSFYSDVIVRIIQIYDFGAFRREYLNLMDRVLKRYESEWQNNYILKTLVQQKQTLKDKVCMAKKIRFAQYPSSPSNSIKQSKFTLKMKKSRDESIQKDDRQKSLSLSKKSSLYSPRSKFNSKQLKQKKYINPYGLQISPSEMNKCIFM